MHYIVATSDYNRLSEWQPLLSLPGLLPPSYLAPDPTPVCDPCPSTSFARNIFIK